MWSKEKVYVLRLTVHPFAIFEALSSSITAMSEHLTLFWFDIIHLVML